MKKSILNLGKELNKKEQKKINGGLSDGFPVISPCWHTLDFCKMILNSAGPNGPQPVKCEPCETHNRLPGYRVRYI